MTAACQSFSEACHEPIRHPNGQGKWTATWTPRQFLDGKRADVNRINSEAGSRTYIPMDVDIYGAAASHLAQTKLCKFLPFSAGPVTVFFAAKVASCIRDMQVLSLGSHQNAGRLVYSLYLYGLHACFFQMKFSIDEGKKR